MSDAPLFDPQAFGVDPVIDPDAYPHLMAMYAPILKRFAHKPAFENFGRTITFAQLDERSDTLAAYFQSVGYQKGDRIALMMPNILQYPIAVFAAMKAGLTVVNLNPLYTVRELTEILQDARPRAILVLDHFTLTVQEALQTLSTPMDVLLTGLADVWPGTAPYWMPLFLKYIKRMIPAVPGPFPHVRWRQAMALGAQETFRPVELSGACLAFLQYTGGTTGTPKGAMLTHRNVIANILQTQAWIQPLMKPTPLERVISPLPLYHIFSLTVNLWLFMTQGCCSVLITNPRDMDSFIGLLIKERPQAMTGVNTLFAAMMRHPRFSEIDFSGLKIALGGGMAVQKSVAEQWLEKTGHPLVEGYGLTEASPVVTINRLDKQAYTGKIGYPIPQTQIRIVDAQGQNCPQGDIGELWVRGPQVMQGYWQRPEESAQILDDQGWLKTGDMAYVDPTGCIELVDRKKDMVLISGFNVYPSEIEEVLAHHPGVLEVAVIGSGDVKSQEHLVAFIVPRSMQHPPAITSLIAHARRLLAAYKVPRIYEFHEQLPKSNVGKILHRQLKEMYAQRNAQPSEK